MDKKNLEKILKAVFKKGKVIIGTKQVSKSIKGSKLIICSSSLPEIYHSKILNSCKSLSIPCLEYEGTSLDLAKICGKLFPISVLSIKSTNEIELSSIVDQM